MAVHRHVETVKAVPMNSSSKMRPTEAAAYVQMSVSKLAKLRMNGAGPHYSKIDRLVVYDKADVDEWLHAHKRMSTKGVA
jgi:predicted DNA-binding transcriptional regulator AlpA